jgi:hypothetical protein
MAPRWTWPLAAFVLAMASPIYRTSAQGQVVAETGAMFVTFEQEQVPPGFAEAVEREGGRILFNLPGIGVSVVAGLPETSLRRLASEQGGADVAPDVSMARLQRTAELAVRRPMRGGCSRPRHEYRTIEGGSNQGRTTGRSISPARNPPRRLSPAEGCASPHSGTSLRW